MALIKCPECGKDVSDKAVSCPFCGYPLGATNVPQEVVAKVMDIAVAAHPNAPKKDRTLKILLALWTILTIMYTCSLLGFLMPFPFGILTLIIFGLVGLPIPNSLMDYPTTLSQLSHYDVSSTKFDNLWYMILLWVNAFGVIFSVFALRKIKKTWQWAYVFVGLSVIQLMLAFSNAYLGACNFDSGDGGNFLDGCSYGFSPKILINLFSSLVIVAIGLSIFFLAKRNAGQQNRG